MQARRNSLRHINIKQVQPSHAGLWLDRYLCEQLPKGQSVASDKATPQQQLVEEVSNIKVPAIYEAYYKRWQRWLLSDKAVCREARVQGRLIVGLGNESVIETSVHLHHTYGVPVIPGSALKGLAASYAHQQLADPLWKKGGEAHEIMFGTTKSAGFITFYDALYIPGSGQPLYPDVITVHHQGYYQLGKESPADWDNPNPISFLSATGKFLIAIGAEGDIPLWLEAAFNILKDALWYYGVGAKSSSGYGRLILLSDKRHTHTPPQKRQTQDHVPPKGFERGRIKTFGLGNNQSYGFIIPDRGGKDIFIHRDQLPSGLQTLQEGQYVYFRRVRDQKGEHAEAVQLA